MKFTQLKLFSANINAQRAFYNQGLGLPVLSEEPDLAITFQAGASELTFEHAAPGWEGVYHFAFNIPENQFAATKDWISPRAALIRDESGQEEFDFPAWNAHSLYFPDADGNILELIARHDLQNASDRAFGGDQFLSISEVGLGTEDVKTTAQMTRFRLGEPVYRGSESADFTAVGDEYGLLIIVQRGRVWYPDTGKTAGLLPLSLSITNQAGVHFQLSGPPYEIVILD